MSTRWRGIIAVLLMWAFHRGVLAEDPVQPAPQLDAEPAANADADHGPATAADNEHVQEQGPQNGPPAASPHPIVDVIRQVFGPRKAGVFVANPPPEEGAGRDLVDSRAFHDPTQSRRLEQADRLFQSGKLDEGARVLQSLLELPQDSLIQRADGSWESLQFRAEQRLTDMAPEARQVYEGLYGALAERTLGEAVERGDLELLAAVAGQYLQTAAGQKAADLLASITADRGDFIGAAHWYDRLVDIQAPLTRDPRWKQRAALAWHAIGRDDRAAATLNGLATVPMGGGGSLTPQDWLKQLPSTAAVTPPRLDNWLMMYGSPPHLGVVPAGDVLLLPRWRQPLSFNFNVAGQVSDLLVDLNDNQRAPILAFFPVVSQGKVAVRTLRGLSLFNLHDGRLLWETHDEPSAEQLAGGADTGAPLRSQPQGVRVTVSPYMGAGFDQHQLTSLLFRDATYGTLSSDGRRLFAIEQLALMAELNYGYMWGGIDRRDQDPFDRDWASNQLVAYDLDSGRPLWELGGRRTDEPFDSPLAGTYFFGAPVPDGQELFVIGERDNEVRLFALRTETGEVSWSQPLAISSLKIKDDVARRLWTCQPAVSETMIVCPTTTGWLVAVDRHTRRLLWSTRFADRQPETRGRPGSAMYTIQALNTRWCPSAPILSGNKLLFTPPEQPDEFGTERPQLYCCDALTGQKVWQAEKGDALYVAGVFGPQVLLVGRNKVTALAVNEQGKVLWNLNLPDETPPSGRGIAAGDVYLLPLASGELWQIALDSGQVQRKLRQPQGQLPLGNLVLHEGLLLSLGPQEVTCFEQPAMIQGEIAERLRQRAGDLWAAVHAAEIHLLDNELSQALECLDRGNPATADGDAALIERHRQLTFECLLRRARTDPLTGANTIQRLRQIAATPEEHLEARRWEATRCMAAHDYRGASDVYWDLTSLAGDQQVTEGDVTLRLDRWVAGRFADLRRVAPLEIREALDARIAATVAQALAADRDHQLQVERWFDLHPAIVPLQFVLADQFAAAQQMAEAEIRLRRIIYSGNPLQAAEALSRLGDVYLRFQRPAEARETFEQLQRDFGNTPLADGATAAQRAQRALTGELATAAAEPEVSWAESALELVRTGSQYNVAMLQPVLVSPGLQPFFAEQHVEFDPQLQRLVMRRADDESEYWSVPLRSTAAQQNTGGLVSGLTDGSQLVVLHRGVLHALSLLERRLLWTHPLDLRTASQPAVRPPSQERTEPMREASTFAGRYGQRFAASAGMLAAANARIVGFYGRSEFVALDPLTGGVIWTLTGLAPQTMLYADELHVYVVPPDNAAPQARRTFDGQPVDIPDLRRLLRQTIAVRPRSLVLLDRNGQRALGSGRAQVRLSAVDPASGETRWEFSFDAQSLFSPLNDDELAVLDGTGSLHVVDLARGELTTLGSLPEKLRAHREQIHVVADRQRVYLLVDHLPNKNYFYLNLPAVRVNGTVVAFDRLTRQRVWEHAVEEQNLVLTRLEQSPLLVFTRQTTVQRRNIHIQEESVLALDKGTGRTLMTWSGASQWGGFNYAELNLAEQYFEFRSYGERLRIQVARQAAALAP